MQDGQTPSTYGLWFAVGRASTSGHESTGVWVGVWYKGGGVGMLVSVQTCGKGRQRGHEWAGGEKEHEENKECE